MLELLSMATGKKKAKVKGGELERGMQRISNNY